MCRGRPEKGPESDVDKTRIVHVWEFDSLPKKGYKNEASCENKWRVSESDMLAWGGAPE